jgi:hypothetical protein
VDVVAKPAGAIGAGEVLGYLVVNDGHEFIYYGHRIAQVIEQWYGGYDQLKLRARYKSCCTVDVGHEIYLQWPGLALEVRTGPIIRQWSAAWLPAYQQHYISNMGSPDPHAEDPDGVETLRSRIGDVEVWAGDKQYGYIHAIMIELYHDEAYADLSAEIIDRSDVGADLIHLPNMPVSSWQMQRILCDTYNKLAYQSRLVICLPLFKTDNPV